MSTTNKHQGVENVQKILTIPNILSISRLFFLPLVLFFLFRHESIPAVIIMLISWLTDGLDGFLARKMRQVSNVGKVLDHLVDKIWVAAILITLVNISNLPLHLAWAVIIRDLLILTGSAVVMKERGTFVSSDVVGKITGFVFALLILYYTLSIDNGNNYFSRFIPQLADLKNYVDYTVLILIIVSFLNYVVIFLRLMIKFRLPGEQE